MSGDWAMRENGHKDYADKMICNLPGDECLFGLLIPCLIIFAPPQRDNVQLMSLGRVLELYQPSYNSYIDR